MTDDVAGDLFAAQTPQSIAAAAEAKVLGEAEARAAIADEGVTPGYLEDLDDGIISATVGPGALDQPLGPEAAREAAKQFPNETAPVSRAEASMLHSLGNLTAQESALRHAAGQVNQAEGGTVGEYYGDMRTGQVLAGAQIPEDHRIGPFRTPAIARAALIDAQKQYRHPN